MNNVTIGKYIHGNSMAHKMDPRIKLLLNIAIIVLVFMSENPIMLGCLLIPSLLMCFFSPIKKIHLFKMLIPVFLIGSFIFIVNLFIIGSDDASNIWWNSKNFTWWKITLSDTGLIRTTTLMIRIYIMIVTTTLLISSTNPTALTRAIEDLLLPLKLIRVPVHVIAMIISIALRFIPTLLSETQRIMKAQASRGVDFKNGNIKSKIKSLITLIIPLFVSAFAKAEDLGNAMEVRGYDPYEKRVRYRVYKPGIRDFFAFIVVGGLIALFVMLKIDFISLISWY